jgi:3-hydroxyisobutyrate dehydrogenase-like beta-hydroxyacid dehydrogenase
MGLPICHGLHKSGFQLILPAYRYRREIDQTSDFSALTPDATKKAALIDHMLNNGALGAENLADVVRKSDVILLSMPTSRQVEELVLASDGILANARAGTIVIDLTSAEPLSTQKLSQLLKEKNIEMLDAPISGGVSGAAAQTLSVMVGGEKEIFERCLPIFETIGRADKIFYAGPSGSGNTVKCANNFLSFCCTAATTEAVMVCAKAGIAPQKTIEIIANSGGNNDAVTNKFPNIIFPGRNFNFTLNLMLKDVNIFNQIAKEMEVPVFIANTVYQLWNIARTEGTGNDDCRAFIHLFEKWCGVKVSGITDQR